MHLMIDAACMCSTGCVRRNNEDNFYFNGACLDEKNNGLEHALTYEGAVDQPFCAAVFDGVGGENFGEKASCTAAVKMKQMLQEGFCMTGEADADALAQALNMAVVAEKEQLLTRYMGATLAGIWIEGQRVTAYNLGDSRIFRFRDGVLRQISVDHTDGRPMSSSGKPSITQYLGINPEEMRLETSVFSEELQQKDRYLLCSDGLSDMVAEGKIAEILQKTVGAEKSAESLMLAALQGGGKDNVTIILADVLPSKKAARGRSRKWCKWLPG